MKSVNILILERLQNFANNLKNYEKMTKFRNICYSFSKIINYAKD